MGKTITINFLKVRNQAKSTDIIKKNKIISDYLTIARGYINIDNIIVTHKKDMICSCGSKIFDKSKDYVIVCLSCGEENEIYGSISSFNDIDRINTSTKYTYDRRNHFKDIVYRYQGKQICTVKKEVYDYLEDMFIKHNLLSTSDVRCEKYKNIKKDHIFTFLKINGYTTHYEDLTLIWCNITGNNPPNISNIENELFDEHDKLIKVYEEIKDDNRKNSLNTKYIFYQLLLKRKIPCDRYDFNVLKTFERLEYHNYWCSKAFDILEWTFTEIK